MSSFSVKSSLKRRYNSRSSVLVAAKKSTGARRSVVASAKRTKASDFVLSNTSGSLIKLNLTTAERAVCDQVLANLGLTAANISKANATLGSGPLKYTGDEYGNGAIFVGTSVAGRHILSFMGQAGADYYEKARKSQEIMALFNQFNVTCYEFALAVDSLSDTRSVDALQERFKSFTATQIVQGKVSVSISPKGLAVGKASASKYITILPLEPSSDGKIQKIIIRCALSGAAAKNLINLSAANNSLNTCYASSIHEQLRLFKNDALIDHICAQLINNYALGSVVTPSKPESVAKVKELRPVSSACTTIVNRLKMPGYSKDVQVLVLQKLVDVMHNSRGEITNYDSFANEICQKLQKTP
jgi:hypothetical protein